jgi:predicted hydrocarbon binding protein
VRPFSSLQTTRRIYEGSSLRGIIFSQLNQFVTKNYNYETWTELLSAAGLGHKTYLPAENYPDEELYAIVGAAAKKTGLPASGIVEEFGKFIAPALLGIYQHLINPGWRTLDVIEHTEGTIHQVVRTKQPGAKPPVLKVTRPRPNEVVIDYRSERKLCHLAVGVAKGLADKFGEQVSVSQSECMHNGASKCLIAVKLVK